VEGISFDDLAEITGKTSGALRVEIMRLKQKVRESFDEKF
jgi:DNA-directed RNA polymerase specialized sigma24 family protein